MISAPDLEFKDGLIRIQSKTSDSKSVSSFTFDFSPAVGRIRKLLPLTRYQHLINLSLVGHGFNDISALSNLAKLIKLNLSYNSITNISPLTNLVSLETLNLSHNKITFIPQKIQNCSKLSTANFSFNRISDISSVQNLQNNDQLKTLYLEGNAIMNDDSSFSHIIFMLPQITILNQQRIQRDQKLQATQRFSSTNQAYSDTSNENFLETTPYKILMNESQNHQLNLIYKINESEAQKSNMKSDIDFLKAEVALSKTIGLKNSNQDEILELKLKIKKIKQKLLTARAEKVKAEEDLELEKTLLLKQRQMYDRLNERYQNERRSKEPRQISKNSNKSIPTSAELRIPSLINENKKLQQTIESMKETESFHIQEISSQRKQIEQLMNQQTQLLSKQTNFNDTASTITTMNISTSSRENENEQENEKIIKELKSKIEELQEENTKKKQEILSQMSTINQLQEQNNLSSAQFQVSLNSQVEALKLQLAQKDESLLKSNNENQKLTLENDQLKIKCQVLETAKEELTKQVEKLTLKVSDFEKEKVARSDNIKQIQDYAEEIVKINQSATEQKYQMKQQISDLKQQLQNFEGHVQTKQNENDKLTEEINELKSQIRIIQADSENKVKQMQKEKEEFVSKISLEIRARDEKIQSLTKLFKDSFHLDTISIENLSSSGILSKNQKDNDEKDVKIIEYERIINELRQKLDSSQQALSNAMKESGSVNEKVQNLMKDKEESQMKAQQIIEKMEKKIKKQKSQISKLNENIQQMTMTMNINNTNALQLQQTENDAKLKQIMIEKDGKIEELTNKLSIQKKESESQIALLTENNNKLQSKITEVQQVQFSLLTHIQNVMNQFDNNGSQFSINEINQAALIQISQFFMNLRIEYNNMKEQYEKAKVKIQDQKSEIMENEEKVSSKQKQIDRLSSEKVETEAKYKSVLEENSQLRSSVQESQSQIHDLSMQLSQLETSSQNSDISTVQNATFYPDEIRRLKKTKHQIKQEKLSLEQQVRSLNKTVFEKTAEIDQLKANLHNSEIYRSEISSSIESIEQRNQVKLAALQKEIAETESFLQASKSREEIANKEIDRITSENIRLVEKLKKVQRKLEQQRTLTNQLEMTISQQKEVSENLTAHKDKKNDQKRTVIAELKDRLSEKTHEVDAQSISHLEEKHQLEIECQTAQKNAQKLAKKVQRLTTVVQQYDLEAKNASKTIITLQLEIKDLKDSLREKEISCIKANQVCDTTDHLFKSLTNKYNELRKEFEEYRIHVDSKEEQFKFMKEIDVLKKENKKLNKELSSLQNHEKSFNDVHSEQSTKIAQLEDQISELTEQKKNSEVVIEKYSIKINELQKTIQILQSHVDESTHLTDSLTNKIIETKDSMIEKSQFDDLQEKYSELSQKKKNLKKQYKEALDKIEQLKKTCESNQNKSNLLQERSNDVKNQLENKINELQELIVQRQNEVNESEKQRKAIKSDNQKLNDQIKTLTKQLADKENLIKSVSQKFESESQIHSQKVEEYNNESRQFKQKIEEQTSIIEQLQSGIKQNEEQANLNDQNYKQQINELEKTNIQLESQLELSKRELTRLKKDLRDIQEEKNKIVNDAAEKDDSIQELTNQVASTVPIEAFTKLKVKYETMKKLFKFNEGKLKTVSYDKTLQYEQLNKEFEEKEENYKDTIHSMTKENNSNKELIRKLRVELQSLSQKVEILSNPNSELCPVGELKLVEKKLKNKESEVETLNSNLNELKLENENLQNSIKKLKTQIDEINYSNEKIQSEKSSSENDFQKIVSLIKTVYNVFIQFGKTVYSKSLADKLNELFVFAKLNAISFYEPQLSLKRCHAKVELEPTLPLRIERIKAIIQNIKEILTSFPVESHFTGAKEIEDDLNQIATFVVSLKDVFDDQKAHIDEVNQILSSQHKTIIQISDQQKTTLGVQSDY